MFSNITEAWGHDPVKEMTEELSKGAFQANKNQSNFFNFKDRINNINQNNNDFQTYCYLINHLC